MTNFCFFCCIRIKDFESPQIPSAPDLFIGPAKIFCERFHLQFPGSTVILYKFQKSRVLQQKKISASLVTWFLFNYTLVVAYTTNDYHDVCLDTTSGLQSYYKLDIFKLFYKGYNATLPDSLPENILKCCSNGYSYISILFLLGSYSLYHFLFSDSS